MRRTFPIAAVSAALLAVVLLAGPSITLHTQVLNRETSGDAGVTYEHSGARWSSDLLLVKVLTVTDTRCELRLGPDAASYHYPVELAFGSEPPALREVTWFPDAVEITVTSGETLRVPADNFRSVR
ncbi:hypothetical protein E1202_18080 [Saccharopolyspora karakumensis]|uniref:Uncharacterized protein n=1 Tax=Saccharopolyspora karakumensis TaxID=2530386 RepID=A0A4R5BLT7_9PSEU|nr:hypothetical protein [Saccharopolyspora karakumensis]TDD86759.1 hypothetical protein E1202_18080 [Saccharopolyspora karakumensis]